MKIKLKDIIIVLSYIIAILGLSLGWFDGEFTIKGFLTFFSCVGVFIHLLCLIIDNWNKIIWKS